MPTAAPLAVLLAVLVAGCFHAEDLAPAAVEEPRDSAQAPASPEGTAPPRVGGSIPTPGVNLSHVLNLAPNGSVEFRVPVRILTIGLDPSVVQGLRARLTASPLYHGTLDLPYRFPPDAESFPSLGFGIHPTPMAPIPVYEVVDAPTLAAPLRATATAHRVAEGVYDAGAVESWLAAELTRTRLAPPPGTALAVLIHLGDVGEHAWRATFDNGYLQPVRYFGERGPMVVFDLSADWDPWANPPPGPVRVSLFPPGAEPNPPRFHRPWERPLPAGGEETVDAAVRLVENLTRFRLLQGPIYPPSVLPCHGITMLVASRSATLSTRLPGYATLESMVDAPLLQRELGKVMGKEDVRLDIKFLTLPQDDPELDLAVRSGIWTVENDQFRAWVDANWARYWVAHEGCQGYLTFLILGDATDDPFKGYSGVGQYDSTTHRRVSFTYVSDLYELQSRSSLFARASQPAPNAVLMLLLHETGHIVGLRHPHDIAFPDASGRSSRSFSSGWTVMSYQHGGRVQGFGELDRINWQRNRIGYAVAEAVAGGDPDANVQAALAWMAVYDWERAFRALRSGS